MKRLSEVVNDYTIDVAPDKLPSLMPEVDVLLFQLEKRGENAIAIQLRSYFEEMDNRETRSRQNAADSRKAENAALDRVSHLEEKVASLVHQLNSAKLDRDALEYQIALVSDGIRTEIQGAYEDGQGQAITALCIRLAGILNLDSELLENMLVQAQSGNVDEAANFMNQLLDSIGQAA